MNIRHECCPHFNMSEGTIELLNYVNLKPNLIECNVEARRLT